MTLGQLKAQGTPREIGRALGMAGRAAVLTHLRGNPFWREVVDPVHAGRRARMAETVRNCFPAIWAEIEGLAEGLDLSFAEVFAWQCRGDILAALPPFAEAEGCTSVLRPGTPAVMAHNEDGYPSLRGQCFLADLAPEGAPRFVSFCYPGSIPGHTFAMTGAGLGMTVNNIRLQGVEPTVPRMVLGRAILACRSAAEALAVLEGANSGGFHIGLGEAASGRLWSVEYGGGALSAQEVKAPFAHANHALHHPGGLASQYITRSSADRQARAEALLAGDPLAVLADAAGPGLPIRRSDPRDPDEENTLATVVMRLDGGGIDWRVYDDPAQPPTHAGWIGG
ncbi:MAG: hypothetical protein BGP11_02605 [Rhodobacterales bacterium 65-51]|uniref:C45 family autoproteolytic acyltransferase/hydolase n=1 Tax=uncultured Gemmobacter sp. TaxID=1095917 RepID=UPI0009617E96|nr:C45 family peptidase [uncultured Gemmobacter sp.]OJY32276.1 MAG: hypothetical protein BGP11_02605 [Rhodobacterales bacterium 65-51]